MDRTVNLLELSDSQKSEYLERASTYLKQRVEENRYYESISQLILEKNNIELELNLPIEGIHEMSSLKATIEKIRSLEVEKRNLLIEIEELKKMADAKATSLENELNALRDEVNSLKTLLQDPEPKEPNLNRRLKR